MTRLTLIALGLALAGCAQDTSPPVQPVNIIASDFCRTMRGILPPSGKPRWSVTDRPESRTDARKVGAAVDSRCGNPETKSVSR